MADQNAVTIANTATEILAANDTRHPGKDGIIYIHNAGSNPVEVGDAEVTYGTGLPIAAGATEAFRATVGREFYGIVSAGTESIRYFIR